jgi:hypothetical protein
MKSFAIVPILALAASTLSSEALACTVCGFGNDPSKGAFIATTGIMTFIPLIMLGAVVWYIWRRTKTLGAASEDANAQTEQTPN